MFTDAVDNIINEAMHQYAKHGKENTSESLRILIQAPKILGQTILPPIILDIGLSKSDGQTYCVILGWYVWNTPNISLPEIASKLLSLEDALNELYDDDEEDSEDSS